MKVLLTGAFGNIGQETIWALLRHGHQVRAFDLNTRANQKAARRWSDKIDVIWGDLRNRSDLEAVVRGVEGVIHLGFIIPPLCEEKPEWAEHINIGGTLNLIAVMQAQPALMNLIFASTTWIHRYIRERQGLIGVDEPIDPIDHYGRHKVTCEKLVRESGLNWTVLRLGAVTPFNQPMDNVSPLGVRLLFRAPLHTRLEMVDPRDAATAFTKAVDNAACVGKILLIGGGKTMQLIYRDYFRITLESVGIGMLPETAFSVDQPMAGDWMDTSESQRLLQFQKHTLEEWLTKRRRTMALPRNLIRLASPFVRRWLVSQSPYYDIKAVRPT